MNINNANKIGLNVGVNMNKLYYFIDYKKHELLLVLKVSDKSTVSLEFFSKELSKNNSDCCLCYPAYFHKKNPMVYLSKKQKEQIRDNFNRLGIQEPFSRSYLANLLNKYRKQKSGKIQSV